MTLLRLTSVLRLWLSGSRLPSSGLLFIFLACVLTSSALRAQTPPAAPQVSEALSAELGQLRTLTEAKDYPAALALIDRLLAVTSDYSYDRILLWQIKAQIFLSEARYVEAIDPLERMILSDKQRSIQTDQQPPNLISAETRQNTFYLLAQLYQQWASESKDPTEQRQRLKAAGSWLRAWQRHTPNSTAENQLFAATLLYQQATLNPDRIDTALVAEALRAAETGLSLQLKPPASLYVLLLAAHQQRGENTQVAELLELLVAQNPANSGYWQQLAATYLALAADAPNERETTRLQLRAILTLERAQARGLLATPAERFNLVALYLGIRQFAPAIALLEKGLAVGTLENTRRNWELLVSAYQQTQRDAAALATIEKAIASLPADGQLEFTLAQLHYTAGRLVAARRHLELAVKKGALEKPGQARLFLAYTAYELKDYPAAARTAREAAAYDDVKKDDLARLTQAIADATKEKS